MKDFSGFDNISGSFPNVVATDASGPTLRDGTPLTADVLNDVWGAFQALLSNAGITPSDTVETASASDLLDAIRKTSGAPGEIVLYATPTDAIDANILPLKGQTITIATYADLVAATYVGDGNNATAAAFYKTSDSGGTTRDTSGTYFVLPDSRGCFLRALPGAATGVDAGRESLGGDYLTMSGYALGESPGQHTHRVQYTTGEYGLERELYYVFTAQPGSVAGGLATITPEARFLFFSDATSNYDASTEIATGFGVSDFYDEVRPYHMSFFAGIRY